MAKSISITIIVHSRDNRELTPTHGTIQRLEWNQSERTKNAMRTFGVLMAATFASIFIPILHFFLVPALFITSFVMALDKLGEKIKNNGGKGECPKCHLEFKVQASKWKERITNNCDHCHEDLEMIIPFENAP